MVDSWGKYFKSLLFQRLSYFAQNKSFFMLNFKKIIFSPRVVQLLGVNLHLGAAP